MADSTIFLCGDVMTGRGVDQILPHPSDPGLHEGYARSALAYVELAEHRNGAIAAPVGFDDVWGDALGELERVDPDARIVNLETSVTTSDAWQPKGINYRMHPRNVPVLTAAGIDCCVLANNHVLDWGEEGLEETLATLHGAGIRTTGAGRSTEEAAEPAVVDDGPTRVLVFGFAGPDCGVPGDWAASQGRPGVVRLPDFSRDTAHEVLGLVSEYRSDDDRVIASIHWGSNWGYEVPQVHRDFAHRLVDSGTVDVVHGHSSHHPRGVEVRAGKLILYGCGDFLNDYEGISGREEYRGELTLMYFPTLSLSGLTRLRMVPLRIERFRLRRASEANASWLRGTLERASAVFGTRIRLTDDACLEAGWD